MNKEGTLENNEFAIDILCVGELLIDFIGHQPDVLINDTRDYHRYLGGSPANVAMNSSRLGLRASIVSTIGADGFGHYIKKRLIDNGIAVDQIKTLPHKPTSLVIVSRSNGTPDFIPYREADYYITEEQISKDLLEKTNIFHTTCFALSKNPARSTILKKAKEAFDLGCTLSIDLNYDKKLWESHDQAVEVIKAYCQYNPLLKISEDDMLRFFNKSLPHNEIFDFFHNEGVETICLTLGADGVKLSQKGEEILELPAIRIEKVMDTTGAGDAFWSGFLYAYIKGNTIKKCLKVGLKLAALKLQNVGRLPDNIKILSELL
jgi:fructokinase